VNLCSQPPVARRTYAQNPWRKEVVKCFVSGSVAEDLTVTLTTMRQFTGAFDTLRITRCALALSIVTVRSKKILSQRHKGAKTEENRVLLRGFVRCA
jgi:hypothetical protein